MDEQPFGFTVRAQRIKYGPEMETVDGLTHYVQHPIDPPNWRVSLPHQCERWAVADDYDGMPQAEAVAEMERFIAEAQQALAALRAGEDFGSDD